MEVEGQEEPAADERSVVLETILGGSEGAVDKFFADVWQKGCAVYRHTKSISKSDNETTRQGSYESPPLTWNGIPENPFTTLITNGWPILLNLLDASRPDPLPRGVDRPLSDDNDDEHQHQQRAILFRHLQVLSPDERAMYHDNLYAAFLNGCSVVINHADTVSPWIASLCDDLQHKCFLHAYANTYLTPAATQTAPPHADDRDVLVVQVYGSKQWTVYQQVPILYPYPDEQVGKNGLAVPETILQGPSLIETVLQPGDVMYMPRGYVHQAVALPSEPSFHVTIALATHDWTTAGMLANELIPKHLFRQLHLRQAVPRSIGRPNDGPETAMELQALQSTIDQALEGLRQHLTAQSVHQHLQAKVRIHNERAARARRALYAAVKPVPPPVPAAPVVGYQAALQIQQLSTRLRAATAAERDACQRSTTTKVGLHVREDVADAVTQIVAHVKQHPTRVCDWPHIISGLDGADHNVPSTLCPLTLIALAKQCVELGAFAIDNSN
eukprot:scaffold1378_cov160-Amphora_coffeaeformis.AAC.2